MAQSALVKHVMFSLYINKITIKGSRVTLDNGGVKVHLNYDNLDAKSRNAAQNGKGYVNLNTYYTCALFGQLDEPVRKVKNYLKPVVEVKTTYVGPAVYMNGKAEHIEMRQLVEKAALHVEGLAEQALRTCAFERGWQRAYKQLTKERSSAASGAHKPSYTGADCTIAPSYIETAYLATKGVANLAIAA